MFYCSAAHGHMIQGGSLFVIKSPNDFAPLQIGDQLIVDLQARYSNKTQVVNPISLFDCKASHFLD